MEILTTDGPNVKVSNIAAKAKQIESEGNSGSIMEPQITTPKRGPGRPKGSTKTVSATGDGQISITASSPSKTPFVALDIQTKEIVTPFVKLMSKASGAYVGSPKAEMTPDELEAMARALGLVADKWMPVLSKDYGAEVLLATTLSAYGMRVMALKRSLEAEKKSKDFPEPKPGQSIAEAVAFPTTPQMETSGPKSKQPGVYISPTTGV